VGKRSLLLACLAALMVSAALPAGAAPDNKNTDYLVPLECGGSIGSIVVRPAPGGWGISAWDVVSGKHYVAKSFSDETTITATIVGGSTFGPKTVTSVKDFGATAPAKGRTLVECSVTIVQDLAALPGGVISEDDAGYLNFFFGTTQFAAGQHLTGTSAENLVVKALVPGSR